MSSFKKLLSLGLFTASAAALPTSEQTRSTENGINWSPCNETLLTSWGASTAVECATLNVPLDYTNTSSVELPLQLAKVPAATQPSKGSILFNFGGPGDPGRSALASLDTTMRNLTGGEYDLIAFDPRGTGTTIPFLCSTSDAEATSYLDGISQLPNTSDTQIGRSWARANVDATLCAAYNPDTASMVGTAFVARDLISVVDSLGEDGMLRYWGLSYGTTLGATVAAMFPDRIDKLVLDGVQNPHEYYHALADFEEWTQADKALSALFSFCVEAGAEACPLAALNRSAADLEAAYWDFLDGLKDRPLSLGAQVFGYSELKTYVSNLLYNNKTWVSFAEVLRKVLSNPAQAEKILTEYFNEQAGDGVSAETGSILAAALPSNALFGIHCGDRTARTNSFEEFIPVYEQLNDVSRVFGEIITQREMTCAQWLVEPKERYQGDFDFQTDRPVLIIGNDGDAFTPVVSARNISSSFENSAVLELTDAYGHCSTAVPSSCSLKHISQYWRDGTLPEDGTKCEVDAKPFTAVTWDDIFAEATSG